MRTPIPKEIRLRGKIFLFLRSREREGLSIYKNKGVYLRLSEKHIIDREVATHKTLASFGFPVPTLRSIGRVGARSYFTEESLGSASFSDLFARDFLEHGQIKASTFERFIRITTIFARAQLKTVQKVRDERLFTHGIHLALLIKELPEHRDSIRAFWKTAKQHLRTFPYVMSHGDLNPHNLYPKGVIDFETVFYAPAGYDIVTNLCHIENFPPGKKYEFPQKYRFTRGQKKYYLKSFDALYRKAGFPSLSENLVYFEFCRDVWSAVRMHRWPNIQNSRYERFIKKYVR